jgi:NTE family protein
MLKYLMGFVGLIGFAQANYNILSFSGGGSFGAVEVGILSRLSDDKLIPKSFDLYTGISAGGLNAGFLSHFAHVNEAIPVIKKIYSGLDNRDVYRLVPKTNISLFTTAPLESTIKSIISKLEKSQIQTLIGTTNLNTGYLDTYYYNTLELGDQVKLLMSTSAIPIVFPPISWKGQLYVDGGEISNQLLEPLTVSNDFINITYITPSSSLESDYSINTFEDIIKRNAQIVLNTFDNSIYSLNTNCGSNKPRGQINMYWINSSDLVGYSSLDFRYGSELIQIGYSYVQSRVYPLC